MHVYLENYLTDCNGICYWGCALDVPFDPCHSSIPPVREAQIELGLLPQNSLIVQK